MWGFERQTPVPYDSTDDYSQAQTEAVVAALVEVGQALQPYRDYIVLRGGLAVYLLTKGYYDFCGAHDIDFAVKKRIPNKGKTIYEIVTSLGYDNTLIPGIQRDAIKKNMEKAGVPIPSNFVLGALSKPVISPIDNKEYTVSLDFQCDSDVKDEDLDHGSLNERALFLELVHALQSQEGCTILPRYGLDLAFVFNSELEIVSNSNNQKTTLKVVDLVGSIVGKSCTICKTYYDVFALTHYNGGPLQAAESFMHLVESKKISKKHQRMLKEFIQELSYNFKEGIGAWAVKEFDRNQKGNAVVKHMNQFIESVSQLVR